MKVKLVDYNAATESIDHAIGMCWNAGDRSDKEKAIARNTRVALTRNEDGSIHSSVLEFATFTFDIEASTKVLLEMTRHRMASYACRSSRYTLNKVDLVFEPTGNEMVDTTLEEWRQKVLMYIEKGVSNDIVSLMLPQAYQYKWTCMFNARSLRNFFKLRRSMKAHKHIRDVANAMYESIPTELRYLFDEH